MSDHEERLTTALAELPRVTASRGFNAGVMQRISALEATSLESRSELRVGREHRPGWRRSSPLLWAAAMLLVTFAALAVQQIHHRTVERRAATEIAALQAEYDALARELATLEQRAARARPVVHLGGDENLELVLDVASFATYRPTGAATPAERPRPIY